MVHSVAGRRRASAAVPALRSEGLHLSQHGTVDSVGGEALLLRQQLEALLVDERRVGGEREESRPLAVPERVSRLIISKGRNYLHIALMI